MKKKKLALNKKLFLDKKIIATLNTESTYQIKGGAQVTFTTPECVPTAKISCLGCPPPTVKQTCLGTCVSGCFAC